MKKIFLIPMMAIMCTISAWGVDVANEADLRAALQLTDGAQINLLNDIHGTNGTFYVPSGANVTLNLAGHSLTIDGPGWDANILDEFAVICNNGNLTIIEEGDGMVIAPMGLSMKDYSQSNGFCFTNGGTLTINGGIFLGQPMGRELGFNYGNPVIFNQSDVVSSSKHGSLTLNGGTYILPQCTDVPFGGVIGGGGNVVVNGGQFSSNQVSRDVIDDYLGEGCSVETIDFSQSYASWVSQVYHVSKAGSASGKTYEADEILAADVNAEDILIKSGVTVTIPDGKTMTASSDLAFEDGNATLVIDKGGALIVDDEIHTSAFSNIELTMDATVGDMGKYSNLLIKAGKLQEGHAHATVHFNTICNFDGATYKWQRFAVPTFLESVKASDLTSQGTGYKTAIYKWNNASDSWVKVGNDEILLPFHGYIMTINADAQADYDFQCELVGNGNPQIALESGWNVLANSYTAPLDLKAMLTSFFKESSVNAFAYVQQKQDAGSNDWDVYAYANVVRRQELPIIHPMQAFIVNGLTENKSFELDYQSFVYNSFPALLLAPTRHQAALDDLYFADIVVEAENGQREVVSLSVSEEFSNARDNGFDVDKFMNTERFNFYAVTELGNLAYVASNNLDETALTLETKDQTSYVLKFENVNLEGYAVRDNITEDVISIAEESEYAFTAEADSKIEGRFVIVKQQATGIENAATTAKKGIYSLTGQYMGENFDIVPAGMYIINGKKVVK